MDKFYTKLKSSLNGHGTNRNLFYIGIQGLAGSGKDTVAKMLRTILCHFNQEREEVLSYYKNTYLNAAKSSTYHYKDAEGQYPAAICIAYADELKKLCSIMFGIPVEQFYINKSHGWVCMNDKFQYRDEEPDCSGNDKIITAEEYYNDINIWRPEHDDYRNYFKDKSQGRCWMNLREILVFVGTYLCQYNINTHTFVNIVRNKIKDEYLRNKNLEYVILTDTRFPHELDFLWENHGIIISVRRDSVTQLENITEHNFDDYEDNEYDYIISNNGTLDELFNSVWDITHENDEFKNITVTLHGRNERWHNYLRLIDAEENLNTMPGHRVIWQICTNNSPQAWQAFEHQLEDVDPSERLCMFDLVGGPTIMAGEELKIDHDQTYEEINHEVPHLISARICANNNNTKECKFLDYYLESYLEYEKICSEN